MTARRPLEDVLAELAAGLPLSGAIRATSAELMLPVEARVVQGPDGLRVETDLPRTRTRTDFDLPISRLLVRLDARPPGGSQW